MQKSIAAQQTTTKQRGHARSTRWIATLAVAGTTAFCAAAAAQAATTEQQAPGQAASPACASLQSDFDSTLLQAAKNLLATPPNMGTATGQVDRANKLDDAMNSLDCANTPTSTTASTPASSTPASSTTASSTPDSATPSQQSATSGGPATAEQAAAPSALPQGVYFGAPLMQDPATASGFGTDTLPPLSVSQF